MRIVFLRSNGVKPDSRVEKEVLTLIKCGHSITILAWDRDENYSPSSEILYIGNCEIPIIRFGIKASFGEGMKNVIQFISFQQKIKKWLKQNVDNYDAVHACDYDTAMFTYKYVLKKKKFFVFDIFDFKFGMPKNFIQKIVKNIQIKIINRSTATIICSEKRKEQIRGSNPKKLYIVHNSPSEDQMPENRLNKVTNASNSNKFCYVGILSESRLLKEIGYYFSKHESDELYIGGFGLLNNYFEELSSKHPNIHFYGKLSYEKTLLLEQNCDFLFATYDPLIENHIYAAPNKFYEGLFLGKPLIMVNGTGMSDIVQEHGFGVIIEYNYASLEKGISEIKKLNNSNNELSRKMSLLYEKQFSWKEMGQRLASLYSSLEK